MVEIKAKRKKKVPRPETEMVSMIATNGNKDDNDDDEVVAAASHPMDACTSFLSNLCQFLYAYIVYHKSISAVIGLVVCIVTVTLTIEYIAKVSAGHHHATISHDYAHSTSEIELKMAQIDHWCLQVKCRVRASRLVYYIHLTLFLRAATHPVVVMTPLLACPRVVGVG